MSSSKAVSGASTPNQYPPSSFLPSHQYPLITVIIPIPKLTPTTTTTTIPCLSQLPLSSLINHPLIQPLPLPRYLYYVLFLLSHAIPTTTHIHRPLRIFAPTHIHFNGRIRCHLLPLRALSLAIVHKSSVRGMREIYTIRPV